jgi:hypothetical protein
VICQRHERRKELSEPGEGGHFAHRGKAVSEFKSQRYSIEHYRRRIYHKEQEEYSYLCVDRRMKRVDFKKN